MMILRRKRVMLATAFVALFGSPSLAAADPTKNECIAANESAQDLREAGKLRAARAKLALCVAASCPGPIREDCTQRLADVDAAMPSVIFEVKDSAGNDVSAATVTIDEQAAETLDRRAMALDPGEHRFTFKSASGATAEQILVFREAEKNRRVPIFLGAISRPAASTGSESTVERSAFAPDRIPPTAYVAAGVGLVGLAVGIGTGIAAGDKHAALVREGCPAGGGTCPPSAPQSDLDSFHSLRTASTVGYVIGALGIVGGFALWMIVPRGAASESTTSVWVGPGSAGLAGTF